MSAANVTAARRRARPSGNNLAGLSNNGVPDLGMEEEDDEAEPLTRLRASAHASTTENAIVAVVMVLFFALAGLGAAATSPQQGSRRIVAEAVRAAFMLVLHHVLGEHAVLGPHLKWTWE